MLGALAEPAMRGGCGVNTKAVYHASIGTRALCAPTRPVGTAWLQPQASL